MRIRPVPNRSPITKRPVRTLFLIILSALGFERAESAPAAKLKRVLVFDKHVASQTEPYAAADSMLIRLGREMGFSLRITADSNLINDDTLKGYQAVVWNNVMRNVLSGPQQQAFQRYMENGGGYIGFHAAATNRRIWPWYVDDFLGGDNHDQESIAWGKTTLYADSVNRPGHETGRNHYIMKGVPAVIPQDGEWYRWNPNPADNPAITVLQWYRPKTVKSDWPEALPASWCRELGPGASGNPGAASGASKGRLFYIQVSHMDSIYASPWYNTMVRNALKWVAHDEETAAGLRDAGVAARKPGAAGETAIRLDGRNLKRRARGMGEWLF
jgi:hypothetical protein